MLKTEAEYEGKSARRQGSNREISGWRGSPLEGELRRYRLVRGRAGDRGAAGLADLEADEAAHGDVFADLGDHVADELANRNRLVLNEVLLVEAGLLVKLFHLPVDNFFDDLLGLRSEERRVGKECRSR